MTKGSHEVRLEYNRTLESLYEAFKRVAEVAEENGEKEQRASFNMAAYLVSEAGLAVTEGIVLSPDALIRLGLKAIQDQMYNE